MDQRQQVKAIYEKITGLTDLDWSELADQSGAGLHPDQLRKMGAGIRLAMEAGMLTLDTGAKCNYDVQKLRDLRNEMNAAHRADARSEALREAVIDAAQSLPPMEVKPVFTHDQSADRSLVVAVGDFHYGAEWAVHGLYGEVLNSYSPEVFESRMECLLGELLVILEREDVRHIDLQMCGDSLDGMLRASQLMKLRWGIVESCMRLAECLTRWIAKLAEHASVSVYSVDGNHGEIRPLGSKRGEFENENLEKVVTWYLHSRFEGCDAVRVDPVSETMKLVDIQGFSLLLTHGTNAKTLESLAKQTLLLYGKRIDFILCAHKHKEQESVTGYTDDGNSLVIRVPSLCGMDGYAKSLGYGGKAGATAMVMERGYGRRCVYPILL